MSDVSTTRTAVRCSAGDAGAVATAHAAKKNGSIQPMSVGDRCR